MANLHGCRRRRSPLCWPRSICDAGSNNWPTFWCRLRSRCWISARASAASRSPQPSPNSGLPDVLADGPKTGPQIAARINCDEDTTHRLLRGAVGCGLCTMDRRTGAVKLTRTGAVLRSDHPVSLRAWMRYKGMRSTVDAWGGLAASVRSGRSAFELVHGMSVWEWFAAHPDEQRTFASTMRQATAISARAIARVYPWPNDAVVCDVAGGIGTLLSSSWPSRARTFGGYWSTARK